MKGDDFGYCDATMVITEHLQGDEVVDSGNAEEMGNGPVVEQDRDAEAPHEQTEGETKHPAHIWNKDIDVRWRYGIPLFMVANLTILLVADISSGVTAKTQIIDETDGSIFDENVILTVSIVTSISQLWNAGSKALAVFILLTSLLWPFIKLALTFAAWVLPYRTLKRRERFLEVLDCLDKWSFVDIFVLTIIMVAFRSSVAISDLVSLEVFIVPQWGFYVFVAANMMSMLVTQLILYLHRRVQYHPVDNKGGAEVETTELEEPVESERTPEDLKVAIAAQTGTSVPILVVVLASCIALHFTGSALDYYEVSSVRGDVTVVQTYNSFSIGMGIPATAEAPSDIGIRFLQMMYFLFAVVVTPWNSILVGILYMYPMVQSVKEKVFFLTEITFAWSALEVFLLSVIFSILQIPKFGNGLVQSGCTECYKVDSVLFGNFAVICVSTAMNICVHLWLVSRAHKVVYRE